MKAALFTTYGPPEVVRVVDVPDPRPGPGEVLVRIVATTVSTADVRIRGLAMPKGFGLMARPVFGWTRPRKPILGVDFAGVIEEQGPGVSTFSPGDRVFGIMGVGLGCHAEKRVMLSTGNFVSLPDSVSFEHGTSLPFGGTTALHFLRTCARLQAGERLLVIGASGAVGSAAVQIGNILGAKVDGVAGRGKGDLLRKVGCDHVYDYTKGEHLSSGVPYDVVFDSAGAGDLKAYASILGPSGRLCLVAADLPQILKSTWRAVGSKQKVFAGPGAEAKSDLRDLATWCAAGTFRPLIDRTYPLAEIALAHAYVDTGRKNGSVIVKMES